MRRLSLLTLALSLLAVVTVGAHDFWLAAAPWSPDRTLTVTAHVGERFPHGTEYTDPSTVDRWQVIGEAGDVRSAAFRRDGDALTAEVELPAPGVYLATMAIKPRVTIMKGPAFNSYLHEEGLDWIAATRQKNGVSEDIATERYARYAKVAIRTGAGNGAHLLRPVGFPVEFVPITDPTLVRPGQLLTVQLLAGGKPVVGAEVTARAASGGHPLVGRTSATGQVTLPIDRDGAWLVRTVHMVSGLEAGLPEVEWDSYWATLVFHTATR